MPKKKSEPEKKSKEVKATKLAVKDSVAAKKPSPKKADTKKSSGSKLTGKKKPTTKRSMFSAHDIALRAYFIAERRQRMGWSGDATSDWVEAERQLTSDAKKK